MHSARRRSILSRLVITQSILLIMLAVIIGLISYTLMASAIERAQQSELYANASAVANITRSFINSKSNLVIRIAESPATKKYYKSYNILALRAYLEEFTDDFPIISMVNNTGQEEAKLLKGVPTPKVDNLSTKSHYLASTSTPNKLHFSAPYKSTLMDLPVLDLAYQHVSYFGEAFGPVIVSIPLVDIAHIVAQQRLNLDGHVIITNNSGDIIYANQPSWLTKNLGHINAGDNGLNTLLEGTENKFIQYRIGIIDSMVTMTTVPGFKWKIYAVIPLTSYQKPLTNLRNNIILSTSLILILGLILAYLTNKNIVSPISNLTKIANIITATGDLSSRVSWSNNDEIGNLADSFNTMIDQLHTTHQQIIYERNFTAEVINAMADSLIVTTPDGQIEKVNHATLHLLGYQGNELIGEPLDMLCTDYHHLIGPIYEGDDAETRLVTNYIKSDGTMTPVSITASRMTEGDVVLVAKDITEQQRINRMKDEFISTVSHELRTPITSIQGAISLMDGGMAGTVPDKMVPLLTIAKGNSKRLLMLVNDILDIQKIEAGNLDYDFEQLKVDAFLRQAIKDISPYTYGDKENISYVITDCVQDASVRADEGRIMQVMNNLLSNASKFTPDGGTVELSSVRHDHSIRITVRDYGPGIPEDFRSKIFDRFSQADSSDTRSVGGTGLGLNIAKLIVEKHGGSIGFTTAEGKGATFFFDLPEILL